VNQLLGFIRNFDGCEFDVPTIQTVALWMWFSERAHEAGFTHMGRGCARRANMLARGIEP
jgi:hypothetical protein